MLSGRAFLFPQKSHCTSREFFEEAYPHEEDVVKESIGKDFKAEKCFWCSVVFKDVFLYVFCRAVSSRKMDASIENPVLVQQPKKKRIIRKIETLSKALSQEKIIEQVEVRIISIYRSLLRESSSVGVEQNQGCGIREGKESAQIIRELFHVYADKKEKDLENALQYTKREKEQKSIERIVRDSPRVLRASVAKVLGIALDAIFNPDAIEEGLFESVDILHNKIVRQFEEIYHRRNPDRFFCFDLVSAEN